MRPLHFRCAPADRDDRRSVSGVEHRGRDRIDEALIGIGCKVDRDSGCGGDRTDNLNVQHDLGVSALGASWSIAAMVHRDRHHPRRRHAEALEVRLQVGGTKATAQLDDPDTLALASHARRKVVQLSDLDRTERGARRADERLNVLEIAQPPQMRPGHGPVVQAEHALDATREIGRNIDWPLPTPKGATVGMREHAQRHAERAAQPGHRAGQHDRALLRARLDDDQMVCGGERFDPGHVVRLGAELAAEGFATERLALRGWAVGEPADPRRELMLGTRAQPHGYLESFVRVRLANALGDRDWLLFATREWYARMFGHYCDLCSRRMHSPRNSIRPERPGASDAASACGAPRRCPCRRG